MRVRFRRLLLQIVDLLAHGLGLLNQRGGVLLRLLQLGDFIRGAIALGLQILGFGDRRTPSRINLAEITQQFVGIRATLPQLFFHQFQMVTNKI